MTDPDHSPRPLVTLLCPAFNEAQNLPLLYDRVVRALAGAEVDWELLVIDDHSSDETFPVLLELAGRDERVRGCRLSRNNGSHLAILAGLSHAAGQAVVVLAADLQDPPELIPTLLERWRAGFQVVWAARLEREGQSARDALFARLYYRLLRGMEGTKGFPAGGADFFLLDRAVVEALGRCRESNVNVLALINWLGFRQTAVGYAKEARRHGRSGWSLSRKLKLAMDSVTAFSAFPIRLISLSGFITAALAFLYAGVVVVNALLGHPAEGWSSLATLVAFLGGVQMLMLGLLGEYLWRVLDEVRGRPRGLIEAVAGRLGRPPADEPRPGGGPAEKAGLTP